MSRAKLILITGLSGSGKTTVAACFEDLGYYCVDNLPLPLLSTLLKDPKGLVEGQSRLAVVTDVRAPGFAEEFPRLVDEIDREQVDPTLLFLDASNEALVRRYSETRRLHPLAGDRPVIEGIRHERELLADLRARADLIFDTSDWTIPEIRSQVLTQFGSPSAEGRDLVVSLVSFGFKHGIPYGADLLFDVRFLPNPYFVPGLRDLTGESEEVQTYLEKQEEFGELVRKVEGFLEYLLPHYRRQDRGYLTVAIGCTGGRHRSVAVAERLSARLERAGWPIHKTHRDQAR